MTRGELSQRIRAALVAEPWQTCRALARRLGGRVESVRQTLYRMPGARSSRAGRVVRWCIGSDAGELPGTLLRRGSGDRRDDCHRYAACLTDLLTVYPHESGQAHCPQGCAHFAATPRHELIGAAMLSRRTQLSETAL